MEIKINPGDVWECDGDQVIVERVNGNSVDVHSISNKQMSVFLDTFLENYHKIDFETGYWETECGVRVIVDDVREHTVGVFEVLNPERSGSLSKEAFLTSYHQVEYKFDPERFTGVWKHKMKDEYVSISDIEDEDEYVSISDIEDGYIEALYCDQYGKTTKESFILHAVKMENLYEKIDLGVHIGEVWVHDYKDLKVTVDNLIDGTVYLIGPRNGHFSLPLKKFLEKYERHQEAPLVNWEAKEKKEKNPKSLINVGEIWEDEDERVVVIKTRPNLVDVKVISQSWDTIQSLGYDAFTDKYERITFDVPDEFKGVWKHLYKEEYVVVTSISGTEVRLYPSDHQGLKDLKKSYPLNCATFFLTYKRVGVVRVDGNFQNMLWTFWASNDEQVYVEKVDTQVEVFVVNPMYRYNKRKYDLDIFMEHFHKIDVKDLNLLNTVWNHHDNSGFVAVTGLGDQIEIKNCDQYGQTIVSKTPMVLDYETFFCLYVPTIRKLVEVERSEAPVPLPGIPVAKKTKWGKFVKTTQSVDIGLILENQDSLDIETDTDRIILALVDEISRLRKVIK